MTSAPKSTQHHAANTVPAAILTASISLDFFQYPHPLPAVVDVIDNVSS
jgi:hypothetical protein